MENPNYYAILTADVRYSTKINANEKILFAEITALSSKNGICWASNNYFSNLYGCTPQAISKWIKNLEKNKFLRIKYIYKSGTKEIEKREISCVNTGLLGINDGLLGINDGLGGYQQPIEENNTSINNKINNKIYSKLESYFFCSDDWFLIWKKWLEYKSEIKSNYKTNLSESTAYKKLLELSNNNLEIAGKIIIQSIENDWKGLFELKNNEKKGSTLNF